MDVWGISSKWPRRGGGIVFYADAGIVLWLKPDACGAVVRWLIIFMLLLMGYTKYICILGYEVSSIPRYCMWHSVPKYKDLLYTYVVLIMNPKALIFWYIVV